MKKGHKQFATEKYNETGAKYSDGEPYINHVERVASFFNRGTTTEIVAWLHDVVEDTPVELEEIQERFGKAVADGVDAISKRKNPKELYSEYLRRVGQNSLAHKVKIIDLCDNLSNCFDKKGMPIDIHKDKILRYTVALQILMRPQQ